MKPFLTRAMPLLAVFVLIFGLGSRLHAQAGDVSSRFPEIAQVIADYPDDAERSAAFSILFDALNAAAPKPMSRAAYNKTFDYSGSSNGIQTLHMENGAMQNGQYRAFKTRSDQFLDDPNFRRSVLEKYSVAGMASHPRPPPIGVAVAPAPAPAQAQAQIQAQTPAFGAFYPKPVPPDPKPIFEQDSDVFDQLPMLIGFSLPSLIPMALAAWLVLRRSGVGRKILPVPPPQAGGLPALPVPLQVVRLPNTRYAVYAVSGYVLETRIQIHRRTVTVTTPAQTVTDSHGHTTTTAATSSSSTTTNKEMTIWVRKPDGLDASWTVWDSAFDCRQGQIISLLARPTQNGDGDFVLGYNHSAGTLEWSDLQHHPRGNELGQWAANLAGGATAWQIQKLFLLTHIDGSLNMGFVVPWLFEWFILVTISFLIITPWVKNRILKRRNAVFRAIYLPGYHRFFEQGTPLLRQRFGMR